MKDSDMTQADVPPLDPGAPDDAKPIRVHIWPPVRPPVTAAVELACERCGYKIRFAARKKPADYEAMVADFLRKHTTESCHDTTHEAHA